MSIDSEGNRMKLKSLELKRVEIPLNKPFKTALRTLNAVTSIQVKIVTENGLAGYGAASPTVVITGDTNGSIEAAVSEIWARIKGLDLSEWDLLMRKVHTGIIGNTSAKAAVDIALHDLRGKLLNTPLFMLLGNARGQLESDMTISLDTPKIMAEDARNAVDSGFKALKIKLGNDADTDIKRMKGIHDVVAGRASVRLDANQGWSRKEAVQTVLKMLDAGIDIELVEQPVHAKDYEGMRFVTNNLPIPILADESVFSYKDAVKLIQMEAADYINIKLMKTGGIEPARRIADFAEEFGVKCMIGCMMEGPIGIAAAVHLGCGRTQISLADLDVPSMYVSSLNYGFTSENGVLVPSRGSGLGLELGKYSDDKDDLILF